MRPSHIKSPLLSPPILESLYSSNSAPKKVSLASVLLRHGLLMVGLLTITIIGIRLEDVRRPITVAEDFD